MIILIGGGKRGTGKTTLATNLATLRAAKRHKVLLIDAAQNKGASTWSHSREKLNITPEIPHIQKLGNNLALDIKDLQNKYEDIIIDTDERDSIEFRAAMTIADRLYTPIQASLFDILTLNTLNNLVFRVKNFNPYLTSYVLINHATTNPSTNEIEEIQNALPNIANLKLVSLIIKDRIAYTLATKEGLAVTELDKQDAETINEVTTLYNKIFMTEKDKKSFPTISQKPLNDFILGKEQETLLNAEHTPTLSPWEESISKKNILKNFTAQFSEEYIAKLKHLSHKLDKSQQKILREIVYTGIDKMLQTLT